MIKRKMEYFELSLLINVFHFFNHQNLSTTRQACGKKIRQLAVGTGIQPNGIFLRQIESQILAVTGLLLPSFVFVHMQ